MTDLLTPAAVSRETNVSLATLSTWRCRGGGPRFVKLGKRVAYRRADLEAWINSNSHSHTV